MSLDEHQFEYFGVGQYSRKHEAQCSCANPDGDGVGRMDFSGSSVDEVVALWADHVATADQPSVDPAVLRAVPVQARSAERLVQLETAALIALNRFGRDAFTTAQVAELAGASIGTVYRYFPDRVALLDHVFPNRETRVPPLPVGAVR